MGKTFFTISKFLSAIIGVIGVIVVIGITVFSALLYFSPETISNMSAGGPKEAITAVANWLQPSALYIFIVGVILIAGPIVFAVLAHIFGCQPKKARHLEQM